MKQALVSDIHSNIEALEVVMRDIEAQGCDDIVCLGDVIGYGPDPAPCIDIAIEHFRFTLRGNHEEAVVNGAYGFNPTAKGAIEWTKQQIKPGWFAGGSKKERWQFISTLPTIKREKRVTYVHGSPRDHTMDYVLPSEAKDFLGGVPPKIQEIFDLIEWVVFIGHTHLPGVILESSDFLAPADIDYSYTASYPSKLIVNIGSVGQPRDGDTRLCYVIWDGKTITWRRLKYDFETTARKIRAIPPLGDKSANRLFEGS